MDKYISLHEVTLTLRSVTPHLQQCYAAVGAFCQKQSWYYWLYLDAKIAKGLIRYCRSYNDRGHQGKSFKHLNRLIIFSIPTVILVLVQLADDQSY